MNVTILHISDLHRDSESQLTSTTLLQSLLRDRTRFIDEGHGAPQLAVISGDIVYGVRATEDEADTKLTAQYDEALDFLNQLADLYFEGDRERIIIVPGNHDVSVPHVERSLKDAPIPADAEGKKKLLRKIFRYDTKFRWDWNNFTAYEILDEKMYADRMSPFADFYGRFYQGKRTFLLDPAKQFAIHDFPALRLAFLALSSCHQNDLYNRTGRIHPDALAQGATRMVELSRLGRLGMGVWHHNIQGGPNSTDYADPEFLQVLLDGMCTIGMHGHQHRPQLVEQRFSADRRQGISIVSAGTLCGGPGSLPSGRTRSYNFVELDLKQRIGKIFVRSMTNADFSSPIWAGVHVAEFSGASVEFEFVGVKQAVDGLAIAVEADKLAREGKCQEALVAAKSDLGNPYLRRTALAVLIDMGDWAQIAELFASPQNSVEFVNLSTALEELGDWGALKTLHEGPFSKNQDIAIRQRIDMMTAKLNRV